jgi:ribonuclease Z
VGFKIAYEQDKGYRIAHHIENTVPPSGAGKAIEFDLERDPMVRKSIFEKEEVKITAFSVDHAPVYPAAGYKFEYSGSRGIVISGDTVYTENLIEQSKGVDSLICEAINQELEKIINQKEKLILDVTGC